jgi:Ca2+-binding RTX toxin-like protein
MQQGGDGRDLLVGGPGNDTQDGGAGNDVVFANLGNDVSHGGAGNDRLFALARGDVAGPGDTAGDTLYGDDGNDRIFVRDGEQDVVDCGAGVDRVRADFQDIVNTNCEVVRRGVPRPQASNPEDTAPGAG